jgi:hypothetical protein
MTGTLLLREYSLIVYHIIFSPGTVLGTLVTTLIFIGVLYYGSRKYDINLFRLRKFYPSSYYHDHSRELEIDHKTIFVEALSGGDSHRGTTPPLPSEMMALLSSVKVFGYLDEPIFLELCHYLQVVSLSAGATLFAQETSKSNHKAKTVVTSTSGS